MVNCSIFSTCDMITYADAHPLLFCFVFPLLQLAVIILSFYFITKHQEKIEKRRQKLRQMLQSFK